MNRPAGENPEVEAAQVHDDCLKKNVGDADSGHSARSEIAQAASLDKTTRRPEANGRRVSREGNLPTPAGRVESREGLNPMGAVGISEARRRCPEICDQAAMGGPLECRRYIGACDAWPAGRRKPQGRSQTPKREGPPDGAGGRTQRGRDVPKGTRTSGEAIRYACRACDELGRTGATAKR